MGAARHRLPALKTQLLGHQPLPSWQSVGVKARFKDRREAGQILAGALAEAAVVDPDTVVLGLPRGGVVVAVQVAEALELPLDIIIVRKLGVPWQPELAFGAVGEGEVMHVDESLRTHLRLDNEIVSQIAARERLAIEHRAELWRHGRPPMSLQDKTALIVDDGIATGATARAACQVARGLGADRVVVATPVAPPDTVAALRQAADRVIGASTPSPFGAVGYFYDDFSEVSDQEVQEILAKNK